MKLIIERNLNGRFKTQEITNCKKIELLTLSKGLVVLHDDILSIIYLDIENGDNWVILDD